jgi:hypothetical protein
MVPLQRPNMPGPPAAVAQSGGQSTAPGAPNIPGAPGGGAPQGGPKQVPPELAKQIDPNNPTQMFLMQRLDKLQPPDVQALQASPQICATLGRIFPEVKFAFDLIASGKMSGAAQGAGAPPGAPPAPGAPAGGPPAAPAGVPPGGGPTPPPPGVSRLSSM